MMVMRNVVLIGDLHIKTKADFKFVSKWMHDNLSHADDLILMGDLIDAGLDRGMSWDAESVNEQIKYLKKLLEPYKILGYVLGNHERRIWIKTGMNPYQLWLGDETTQYVINGKILAVEHGRAGAQNQQLELQKLSDVYPKAFAVALGHTHSLGIYMMNHSVIGVRTGSLQQYPDYARRSIMVPKTLGCIRYYPTSDKFELVYDRRRL